MTAVDDGAEPERQRRRNEDDADGEHGRVEPVLGGVGDVPGVDADKAGGRRPERRSEGEVVVLGGREGDLENRGGDEGDDRSSADERDHPGPQRGQVEAGAEAVPEPDEVSDEDQADDRRHDAAVLEDVEDRGGDQDPCRDQGGDSLATPDAASERQQPESGEGDEDGRRPAHRQRHVVHDGVEMALHLRRDDGRDEVEQPDESDDDGGEAPDTAQADRRVDERRPPRSRRVGGDDSRLVFGPAATAGGEAFERRSGGQVDPRLEEAGVDVRASFDLDPRDLPVVEEDRGQAEARVMLGDDFRAGPRAGVEARLEMGELRLQRVSGDEARGTGACELAGRIAGRVVGAEAGLPEDGRADRPPRSLVEVDEGGGDEHELTY